MFFKWAPKTDPLYYTEKVEGKQIFVKDDCILKQFNHSQVFPVVSRHLLSDIVAHAFLDYASQPATFAKYTIKLTEIVPRSDPRARSPEFEAAKLRDVNNLDVRKTWEVIHQSDLPQEAIVLGSQFVLTLKDADTDHPRHKARLVLQGHRDAEKPYMVLVSTTVRPLSLLILCAVAAQFNFQILLMDVSQAYILRRKYSIGEYVIPPPATESTLR